MRLMLEVSDEILNSSPKTVDTNPQFSVINEPLISSLYFISSINLLLFGPNIVEYLEF